MGLKFIYNWARTTLHLSRKCVGIAANPIWFGRQIYQLMDDLCFFSALQHPFHGISTGTCCHFGLLLEATSLRCEWGFTSPLDVCHGLPAETHADMAIKECRCPKVKKKK